MDVHGADVAAVFISPDGVQQRFPGVDPVGIAHEKLNDVEFLCGQIGQLADLTAKEFDVIEFLMRNPNRVYSREALLDTIWAYEYRSDIRTVDVHIRRLREKLEKNPAEPKYILTKWGVGYYFRK